MKMQKDNIKYILIQSFFWMNFPALLCFVSNYLLDCGFQNTHIGIIIAVSSAFSALLQPIVGSFADRPSSPSLKKIMIFISFILLLFAGILIVSHHRSMITSGIFFGLSLTLVQLLLPLVNSLAMESINQGRKINFGVARGIGSLSYALTSWVVGLCIAAYGTIAIPWSTVVGFGTLIIALFIFPFQKTRHTEKPSAKSSDKGLAYFFSHYRRFCIVLIGCVFIYIGHSLVNNYLFQIVEAKGGNSSDMGLCMSLSAVVEIPAMFLFVYMVRKVRCDIWFRMTGIFFLLKQLGTWLTPSVGGLLAMQLLQTLGFGLISVASVYYINSIMDEEDAIKGQAYMTMTNTLGTVLGSLIGGRLIDVSGVSAMLLFATIASAIGMLPLLFVTPRAQKVIS